MVEVAIRLRQQTNELRLNALNIGRKLASRTTALEQHKRFLLHIGSGKIERLYSLVSVALKNGYGIGGIMNNAVKAVRGLYAPHSYDEETYRVATLLWRWGGARAAQIAHKVLHLPSIRSLQNHSEIPIMRISPSYPRMDEVLFNLSAMYQKEKLANPSPVFGFCLMVDEIAVENRLRYDAKPNTILGVCREHSKQYSFLFKSQYEADAILQGLRDEKIHFASEATVVALGSLNPAPAIRSARPIAISGTCKRETAEEHAVLLQTIVDACKTHGILVYCLASDGESKRGLALNQMTLKTPLFPSSRLYPLLGDLALFDTLVGPGDLTSDKDYRHVFKRGRNTMLRVKGMSIDGTNITTSIIRQHLSDNGISAGRLDALLNPNDKQDVPISVSLLLAVWRLPEPSSESQPNYARTRRRINIIGKLFSSLVRPYITPSLSLHEQLASLSEAVHISLALYAVGRGAFVPAQLYCDIAIMVKNVYFCVAKTQLDNPEAKFFITLLGTDRLECQFGNLRTIVGNDANPDLFQSGTRLTAAAECSHILTQHPEWNNTPRRLHLSSLDETGQILPNNIDHINPDSWKGDVTVSDVDLKTTWYSGRRLAEVALAEAGIESPFSQMESVGNVTILAPFGVLILNNGLQHGEENEEPELVCTFTV
ncbi:hypothetical protein M422DRAFT_159891 [Sphaerobolus stellatus SS14]|nr:hypothetical protein M422DRAFT_159891 [Sphaerobolus stellatus SS14]